MSLFKKLLLSAFIVLNLGTVLFMNRPKGLPRPTRRPPDGRLLRWKGVAREAGRERATAARRDAGRPKGGSARMKAAPGAASIAMNITSAAALTNLDKIPVIIVKILIMQRCTIFDF